MDNEKTLLQKLTEASLKIESPAFDCEVDYTAKGRRTHYKYASLKACMEAVNAAFSEYGISVWHEVKIIDNSLYAVTCASDGNQVIERCPFPVELNQSSQQNGSEFTYAKRYSLCASFGIVAEDDDDGEIAECKSKVDRSKVPKSKGRNEALTDFIAVLGPWCELHGEDIEVRKAIIRERSDYEDTAEFYRKIIKEYEKDLR